MRSYIAARDSLLNSLGIKNHLGVISALIFSLILSACGGGGADNPGPAENGAPLLTEVSISSGDLSAVTVGNTVTVAITANEAILAPSVMIAGVAADGVTGSATSWTASRVMTADDAAGAISLSISFSDISGVNGVTVTQTTDSSSLTMEINSESGHVIDGPFQNALVFADYNGDGVHNEGEPSDTTDADGAYSLLKSTSTPDAYTIVVHMTAETIDSISGESYADTGVVLKAAAGGEVVTPVTTLLEAIKETDPTYTAADLATDLGLPVGVDVTTYNPFADGVAAADAQAVEKVFQSVMSATLIVGEAMSGLSEIADVTVSAEKTRATAMDAIAAMVLASEVPVDLSDSTQLDAVKVEAESKLVEIGVVVDAAIADFVLDKATDTLEQVTTAIDNVSLEDFGKPAASAVSRIKHNATAELAAMSAAAMTFLADAANTDLTGFDTSATLTLDVPGNVASVVASNMEAVNQHLGIDTDSSAPLVVFANGELINGATLEVDAQDGGDNAAIIALAASATDSNKQVIQISTRDSTMAAAWIATDVDVSSMSEGNLSFDIYMVTAPTAAGDQNFEVKLESGPADAGVPGYATGIGNETALGGDQWHTITLPLSGLLAANQWAPAGPVDATNVSKIVFAAQWTAGQGAVFQIDNVKFTTNSSGSNEGADSGTDSGVGSGLVEGWNLFGGAQIDGSTFTFPAGADSWAGFANKTESLYPFSFPDGGTITFNASIPAGADPVNVKFTFENAPHPDNNPNFSVAEVSVDSATETTYSVSIPAQDANQEYRSFLMYVVDRDAPVTVCNVQVSTGDEVVDGIPCAVADDSDGSDTNDSGSNDESGSTDNSGSADDSSNGGSTDASVLKLTVSVPDGTQSVTITGPWWNWGSSGLVGTDNGDGTWTVEMTPGTENMEYLWVVDGVQENLLSSDFSCTPVTDNNSYANRVWTLDSGDVSGDTYGSCTSDDSSSDSGTGSESVALILDDGELVEAWSSKTHISAFDEGNSYQDCTDEANSTETCPNIDWTIVQDAERGDVLQVTYVSNAQHAGIVIGPLDGWSYDVSDATSFAFDIKVLNRASATGFKLKLESGSSGTTGDQPVIVAESSDWQTITVETSTLTTQGLDLSKVKTPFVFAPDYQTGGEVEYLLDNVRFEGVSGSMVESANANVTFTVDMSGVDLGGEVPTVQGTFNGWCGACNPMADEDNDDVWTLTIPLAVGDYEYKYALGAWVSQENVPASCSHTIGANRSFTLSADLVLPTDTYSGCPGDSSTPQGGSVTFSVDMTGVDLQGEVVTLQSTFNNWCGACNPMADDDNDDIWTLTVELTGGEHQYKYALGAWVDQETVPSDCSNTIGANRLVNVDGDAVLATDVYNGCPTGGASTDTGEDTSADSSEDTADSSSTASGYCASPVTHLNIEAETASAALLTIENSGANQITVSIESSDADPVDLITIGAMADAAGLSAASITDGVASIDLIWNDGAPATTSFEVLWSKASTEGNWMLNQEALGVIDTSATCSNESTSESNTSESTSPTIVLPVDFEEAADAYEIAGFDGGIASVEAAPDGGQALKYVKGAGANWAGVWINLDTAVDPTAGTAFTARVYSTVARALTFKFDAASVERAVTTSGSGWETLTFDFGADTPTGNTKIAFFNDLSQPGDGSDDWTIYIDDLAQVSQDTQSGTSESTSPTIVLPVDFEEAADAYEIAGFDGGIASVEAAPDGGQALKYVKGAGANWAGVWINLDTAVDPTAGTAFTARVYSTVARALTFKFDAASVERAVTTSGSGWETLTFDFGADTPTGNTKIAFFNDLSQPGDGSDDWTIYIDDLIQVN